MKDEPTNTKGSLKVAMALSRHFPFFQTMGRRLGQTATRALVKTQRVMQKEINLPPLSLRNIRNVARQQKATDSRADLIDAIERSNEELASATTVFPIDVFPDTIILDRAKLTITHRAFLMVDVMSIRIEDILNVSATVGPFFGSLTVATRVMSSVDHFTVKHLWKDDVLHLKHMIQGYVIARQNNFSTDHLSCDELKSTLRDLGHDYQRTRRMRSVVNRRIIQ